MAHSTQTTASPVIPAKRAPTPISPSCPLLSYGNVSNKAFDTTNAHYPLSFERIPASALPFLHPKWHSKHFSGEMYEIYSPIAEEYDPVTGFVEGVEDIRESIEGGGEVGVQMEDGCGNWSWSGYVKHPESRERSTMRREAKRARQDAVGSEDVARVEREKRLKRR